MPEEMWSTVVDLSDIVLRSVLSLLFLFLATRLMGKKQISQLTFFDYVVGISIGSLSAEMAATDEVPYQHALLAIVVYALIAWLISIVTNKSIRARRFFTGHAFLLIEQGKILKQNLKRVKYDVNDLLSEARNAGYFNIADIEYALLETNGKISFLPKGNKLPPTLGDLQLPPPTSGLVANVIIDGKLMKENLKFTGLDESWLRHELERQHANSISDIILATIDQDHQLSVYPMVEKNVSRTPID